MTRMSSRALRSAGMFDYGEQVCGKGHTLRDILRVSLAVAASTALLSVGAQAQGKLEARYSASLAGIPLGTGTWVIDIAPDQYTAVASGRTTGLVSLISDGSGSSGSRGTIQGASLVPTTYASRTISDRRSDDVRMTLRA